MAKALDDLGSKRICKIIVLCSINLSGDNCNGNLPPLLIHNVYCRGVFENTLTALTVLWPQSVHNPGWWPLHAVDVTLCEPTWTWPIHSDKDTPLCYGKIHLQILIKSEIIITEIAWPCVNLHEPLCNGKIHLQILISNHNHRKSMYTGHWMTVYDELQYVKSQHSLVLVVE